MIPVLYEAGEYMVREVQAYARRKEVRAPTAPDA